MAYQLSLPFFEDFARRKSLEEIFEAIFASLDEEEDTFVSNIDAYLSIVTRIKDIFRQRYSISVGSEEYKLETKTLNETFLHSIIKDFENKWIIAVDESQHEEEEIAGSIFYRSSLALGFKLSENRKDERVLALLSSIRFLEDSETTKRKIELQTYIQNLLVSIYASFTLIALGERIHSVILDGPLIRMLGPFLSVKFSKRELERLFTLDKRIDNINNLPPLKMNILNKKRINLYDLASGKLLEIILSDEIYKNIIQKLRKEKDYKEKLSLKAGEIPGIIIYFYLLKILADMSNEYDFSLISCVKATERTTEFLKIYFIFALLKYLSENPKTEIYKQFQALLGKGKLSLGEGSEKILDFLLKLNIRDDQILTFALDFEDSKVNYVEPVEIRRHRSKRKNKEDIKDKNDYIPNWEFGSADDGWQDNYLESLLISKILPEDKYKFMMTYIRTSELKAPLRIEFLKYDKEKVENLIASIYLFSYPYQHYGIPIMLKYVDDLVRIPSKTFKTISKGFVSEKLIDTLTSREGISINDIKPFINSILDIFKRDFISRGGLL